MMHHRLGSGSRVVVALVLMLGLRANGRADSCCDESSAECKTGQAVGDKGSCTVAGEVCVQLASECPKKKKHPGVLCQCGTKASNLGVSAQSLQFDKTFRGDSLMVTNAGNVPVDITIMESGDTEAFAISSPKKCKKPKPAAAERREFRALTLPTSTATVHGQGCVRYKVRFKAKKKGSYSDQLDIQSNAITPPTEAFTTFFGSVP